MDSSIEIKLESLGEKSELHQEERKIGMMEQETDGQVSLQCDERPDVPELRRDLNKSENNRHELDEIEKNWRHDGRAIRKKTRKSE